MILFVFELVHLISMDWLFDFDYYDKFENGNGFETKGVFYSKTTKNGSQEPLVSGSVRHCTHSWKKLYTVYVQCTVYTYSVQY